MIQRVALLEDSRRIENLGLLLLCVLGVIIDMLRIRSLLVLQLLIALPSELIHILFGSLVHALVNQESHSLAHVVRNFLQLWVIIPESLSFNLLLLGIKSLFICLL